VLLDGNDESSRALEPADCPLLRLGVRTLASRHAARAAWNLARFLRHNRIDILQAYFLDSVYCGAPVARFAGGRKMIPLRNNAGYWLTRRHRLLAKIYTRLSNHT